MLKQTIEYTIKKQTNNINCYVFSDEQKTPNL